MEVGQLTDGNTRYRINMCVIWLKQGFDSSVSVLSRPTVLLRFIVWVGEREGFHGPVCGFSVTGKTMKWFLVASAITGVASA